VVTFTDLSFAIASSGDNCSGQPLAAGASCVFSVVFSPLAADVTHAGVNIISGTMTASGTGGIAGTLGVSGWAGSALNFNWQSLSFPNEPVGSTGTNPWPVTVYNTSGQALTGVTYNWVPGTNYVSGAFTLTNTCSTLAAGASCVFDVVSSPQAGQDTLGAYSATLVVSGTGTSGILSSYALPVSGKAVAGGLSINWNQNQQGGVSTIDFGPQAQNVTVGPWPITVYNNTPTAETLTLTPSQYFSTGGSTCTAVPAGGSCLFNLYFDPTTLGVFHTGTLTVTGDVSGSYTFNTWGQANR
jgi:hypothetical protein